MTHSNDARRSSAPSGLLVAGALAAMCGFSCVAWGAPAVGSFLALGLVVIAVLIGRGTLLPPPARHRVLACVASLGLAIWTLSLTVLGALTAHQEDETARVNTERAVQAAAAHDAALRTSIPTRLEAVRTALVDVPRMVEALDPSALDAAEAQLAPLRSLSPPPAELPQLEELEAALALAYTQVRSAAAEDALTRGETHALAGEWASVPPMLERADSFLAALGPDATALRARRDTLSAESVRHARRLAVLESATAALAADYGDAVLAEAAYDAALVAIDALDAEAVADHEQDVRAVRRRVERAHRSNHARAERLRRDRIALAARMALCGPAPTLSAWDGELFGAERYVAASAHDPDSIDVENCSVPALAVSRNHCWLSTCDVLGRNMFGAMVRSRVQFEVRGDRIVGAAR